jgi:hypothetical protein
VGAAAPEREAASLLPLDLVEDVEDALRRVDVERVFLPVRSLVCLRIEALDAHCDVHDAP